MGKYGFCSKVEPDWEAVLKIVRASHTQTANKKSWTIVTETGHKFNVIHANSHFFIFFGKVTFMR